MRRYPEAIILKTFNNQYGKGTNSLTQSLASILLDPTEPGLILQMGLWWWSKKTQEGRAATDR